MCIGNHYFFFERVCHEELVFRGVVLFLLAGVFPECDDVGDVTDTGGEYAAVSD